MYKSFLFSLCMLFSLHIIACEDGKSKLQQLSYSIPPEALPKPKPKPIPPIFDYADSTASVFMGLINAFAYLDSAADSTSHSVKSFQKFANGK